AAAIAARDLRDRLERSDLGVTARWVPAENLHLTLFFLGEIGRSEPGQAGRCDAILEVLAPRFDTPCFVAELGGLGMFPPSGPPRIFWIGTQSGAESLSALHAQITKRVQPIGFEAERREYAAHVTLARVKEAPRRSAAAIRRV